jgi:hypothetical protein
MRKDVDYNVDDKVKMYYNTDDDYMKWVINSFTEFLCSEALLESIEDSKQEWDIVSIFNIDEMTVSFSLKR